MKSSFITSVLAGLGTLFLTNAFAQKLDPSGKFILWKGVKIYEFERADYPDTLDLCYGEWIEKGNPASLSKLKKHTLNKIVRMVKTDNCDIIYIGLKNYWNPEDAWPEGIYCLGLKTRK